MTAIQKSLPRRRFDAVIVGAGGSGMRASLQLAEAGLNVAEVAEAVKQADVVMILLPDEQIGEVYKNDVEPNIRQGASLAFAHGFNVHYGQVVPRADLDVWMVAPKAPGHTVRNTYSQGGGVPPPDRRARRQERQGA